jgi:hypothetical protein
MVDVIGKAKIVVETVIDKSSLDTSSGKIGAGIKTGALVGVAALGGLAVAGVKAFKAFEEGEASVAKLNNVLGNMGKLGAADEVESLASSLQRTTGVSDDTIRSGQTLLATFSEVAASAGEAGGTFERATRAAVDLSAAGFGSVESASVQLGKALQDPVKGISALGRAGVTFTADQKELIKGFVEANDVAAAQQIILKEVEKQVKGTGEASATESAKISQAFGEIEEAGGEALAALLGDGKGGSLSGELFKVSDAISETANSNDWKTLGKNLRGTAGDTAKVAVALKDATKWALGFTDKIPGLNKGLGDIAAGPIANAINAFGDLVDVLESADDAARRVIGNMGTIIDDGGAGIDFGDSDFIGNITSAAGGRIGSGFRLVGENGPELITMGSGGGYVHNNSETRAILGTANDGGNQTTLVFNGPANLSEARRRAQWQNDYGTRFGGATSVGAQ